MPGQATLISPDLQPCIFYVQLAKTYDTRQAIVDGTVIITVYSTVNNIDKLTITLQ